MWKCPTCGSELDGATGEPIKQPAQETAPAAFDAQAIITKRDREWCSALAAIDVAALAQWDGEIKVEAAPAC